jgi:hypothetical protein
MFAVMSRGAAVMNGRGSAAGRFSVLTGGTDGPIVARVVPV